MNTQLHEGVGGERGRGGRGGLVGGLVLVGAGLIMLAGQLLTLGAWPIVLLGVLFTVAGISTHTAGWLIPGGVLNGIGLGALLTDYGVVRGDPAAGGLFLLAFALGWASIYVLSRLFTAKALAWALIPAAVLAAIGAPLLVGGALGEAAVATVLGWLAYAWPLALVAAGVLILARARRR
jgi:hypothetical protein